MTRDDRAYIRSCAKTFMNTLMANNNDLIADSDKELQETYLSSMAKIAASCASNLLKEVTIIEQTKEASEHLVQKNIDVTDNGTLVESESPFVDEDVFMNTKSEDYMLLSNTVTDIGFDIFVPCKAITGRFGIRPAVFAFDGDSNDPDTRIFYCYIERKPKVIPANYKCNTEELLGFIRNNYQLLIDAAHGKIPAGMLLSSIQPNYTL